MYILEFFYSLTGNYGISIILLTVVIRLALYPVIHKQNISTRAMQQIQPEIKKLQEKYKKEPQKLNQEMMKLYKVRGVSPLGGCLPLLVQMPFLFVLYRVLVAYDFGYAGFLWLPNLAQKDPLYALPLLMGATTFLQQKMSSPMMGGEGNQQNMIMMIIMPIFLVFISWSLPAGVLLHWFISNLLFIFQTYIFETQARRNKALSAPGVSGPVVDVTPEKETTEIKEFNEVREITDVEEVKVPIEKKAPSVSGSSRKKGGKKRAKKR
ncbi:MAG TPA: YidC/Oxa1 family membrane protein insertase [Atribacteraceae bacterium]|nr:YidC/Oxa1 family membrane protein insertase [Atribacteraceae bacterium]